MSEFLHMGGYAVFIWASYGLAAVVLIGLLALSLVQRSRARAAWEAINPRRGAER
ncbi:hypothetical protein GCM10011497_27480 [Elstera cyanobacteriorum]|uniref:Heme exporter protein D n=1 Tax=Elstera cyanobacteriorum TaxID=2022747 RepID=A0A255XTN1_9PROT|nr:heme exporter protein CcmD [Elstera cyanobacteriorum]OYQ19785.1 heme exporter protein CcmD [Elstera cyanobacteriorum]GFZ95553.1 hypothetical protein GCM10011497_27480 [Elstera cyanobacteriorum]